MPPSLPGGAEAAGEPQEPAWDAVREGARLKRPEECLDAREASLD